MNPRNPWTSLTFIGYSQYFIVSIFLLFISIVLGLILSFKQPIFWLQKILLYILTYKLACFNVIRMRYICSLCFFKVLLKIKMLSKYIIAILSMYSFNIQLIIVQNIVNVLVSPNNKIKYSKCSNLVLNIVFYSYLSLIRSKLYIFNRSKVINY